MKNINSLKNSSEFKRVYEGGKSFATNDLIMYVLPCGGETRLGISVSKKVGNSVIRHRVTRLIRESFIACKEEIREGYFIVVIARPRAKEKKQQQIEFPFRTLLRRHKLVQ